jgi:hypothetical protein
MEKNEIGVGDGGFELKRSRNECQKRHGRIIFLPDDGGGFDFWQQDTVAKKDVFSQKPGPIEFAR